MALKDFLILMLACFCFGANFVVASWALGGHDVPPFMLAAARAAFVIIIMGFYLFRPLPARFGRLLIVCACVGPIHLGFLYTGLMTAPASGSAIVSQIMIPLATILSVIFLKEKIRWVRGLAIFGAFCGTIVMIYEPDVLGLNLGLVFVIMSYFSLAVGSVVMKTVGDIDWKVYVVWMAVCIFVVASFVSYFTEPSVTLIWSSSKWPLILTALYAAIGVTIIAHGQYFRLVKSYDVSLIVPLMLMVPVFATVLGVWLLDEALTPQIIIGAALILPCVYIIARRQKSKPIIDTLHQD